MLCSISLKHSKNNNCFKYKFYIAYMWKMCASTSSYIVVYIFFDNLVKPADKNASTSVNSPFKHAKNANEKTSANINTVFSCICKKCICFNQVLRIKSWTTQ